MPEPIARPQPDAAPPALLERTMVRQFVKFCIVGAGSTLITFWVYLALIEVVHLDRILGTTLAWARPPAQTIAFLAAVTNGFFWNSRWTFRTDRAPDWKRRYPRFVATNVIGLLLNLGILNLVAHLVPEQLVAWIPVLRDPRGFVGMVAATGVVVFWNFAASKYWTFREE